MSERVINLKSREEFIKILNNYNYIIVKLTASWCGPCKKSTPLFNELFNQMPSKFICVIADIDVVSKKFFNCSSVPTFMNYINGERHDIHNGSDSNGIKNFFQKTLNRA
jgi:thioredoxin 1